MKLTIPELSFVVLIGVSGSGKSTFARKHFKADGNLVIRLLSWLGVGRREQSSGDQGCF
jgi:predicted kinase